MNVIIFKSDTERLQALIALAESICENYLDFDAIDALDSARYMNQSDDTLIDDAEHSTMLFAASILLTVAQRTHYLDRIDGKI